MLILLIFLLMIIIVINSNLNSKIARQTGNGGTKDVEISVPLKYLSDIWRTLEMSLMNCKITLQLTYSKIKYSSNWY